MGVYIPNIEMPKSCDDCPHPTCTLWQSVNGGERNEKCPIVPVPPHGRLIDKDAILAQFREMSLEDLSLAEYFMEHGIDDAIDDLPTIIEAEE